MLIVNTFILEIKRFNFWDSVQAYDMKGNTNMNAPRSVGAIELYPSNNAQGEWYFMSLLTGERIHRY